MTAAGRVMTRMWTTARKTVKRFVPSSLSQPAVLGAAAGNWIINGPAGVDGRDRPCVSVITKRRAQNKTARDEVTRVNWTRLNTQSASWGQPCAAFVTAIIFFVVQLTD
uniref:Uncharacterized protein n=1 Tax=Plectus sambesii TaxID=2011161 RepID=A0A914W186_9BILA